MTAKASNHKDTYRATAVFLALMGILYLVDRLIGFASHGLPWVMQKDTMLLYAAVVFLWFKADKSVGVGIFASRSFAFDRCFALLVILSMNEE